MNKNTYRQYDNRWRWWLYPKKGWYLNGSGCGCMSVFHCCLEIQKYASMAPATAVKTVWNYMKQYAVAGDGTKRDGITLGLKHFGFTDVYRCGSAPMSELWKRLEKGSRCGILLFNSNKGPDGTKWTTGGHYVAYTNYRIKNGKHELYLKDSGSRKHDGWYAYEKSFKGCVIDAWVGKIPVIKSTADTINDNALKFAWPAGTAVAKYRKKGGAPTQAFKDAWAKYCSGNTINTGCHSYVRLVLRASGYSGAMPKLTWSEILKWLRANMTEIKVNYTQAQLKPGDIRVHKNSSGGYHIWVIVKKDGVWYRAEANQGGDNERYAHLNANNSGNIKKHKGDWLFRAK